MKYNLAIVGATGNVGREILKILFERNFPIKNLSLLASKNSEGQIISLGEDKNFVVEALNSFDFKDIDLSLFSPGSQISSEFVPIATQAGSIVIDNTSYFRMNVDVPLIIPEVNPGELKKVYKKRIISNPNCSTIQMLVALKPLHEAFSIKRIIVSTYQSTSGAGKEAMDELREQSLNFENSYQGKKSKFSKQIAYNAIPHIDRFLDDGSTKEEWKMENETKKILDSNIKVHANCTRIPTFIGHAEYINIETRKPMTVKAVKDLLSISKGLKVISGNKDGDYSTPQDCEGQDEVFVSRIRKDNSVDNGLSFWCCSDNLRKGAALNAVQIAEELVKRSLI